MAANNENKVTKTSEGNKNNDTDEPSMNFNTYYSQSNALENTKKGLHDSQSVTESNITSVSLSQPAVNVSKSENINELINRPSQDAYAMKKGQEVQKKKVSTEETEPTIKLISKNPLNNMSDTTLIKTVEELQKNTKYIELENMVFLHFLEKNDPSLLKDMESILTKAQQRFERASTCSSRRLTLTRQSRRESTLLWRPSSVSTVTSGETPIFVEKEGPKINVTQKTDLVLREMEEVRNSTKILQEKYYIERHKLKAQLEEMTIRESDLRETLETFENVFINCTLEKYVQNKNPAEKFSRFMEEWFKKSRLTVDKIRLRTSSLKVQYQKICNQLTQKQLIGENLQEVDFEQLHIENKHLRAKIDQRNLLFLELKKMNGKANLLLSQIKKQVLKKIKDLKQIQEDIKDREEKTTKFDEECEKVSLELDDRKKEYDQIKLRTETYQVPDILDYVKTKAELGLLKHKLKIWTRRKQLKDDALTACVKEMKNITGVSTPQADWFKNPQHTRMGRGSLESYFEFEFENKKEEGSSHQKINKRMYLPK